MTENSSKKLISIVTSCYNEEGNIVELHDRLTKVMESLPNYSYEIICIDNHSTDGTSEEIKKLCVLDPKFKAIFNVRNFGPIRSPWHAFFQSRGDIIVVLCSDLEDPPELIPEMVKKWEEGYKLAMAVRISTEEKGLFPILRKLYYWLLNSVSDTKQLSGMTGFGLYDREVMLEFRKLNEPYPYTRGLISEFGWEVAEIPFHKPVRKRGITKNNFMSYLDMALLAMVNHTRIPIRLATLLGMAMSFFSFIVAFFYLIRKLIFWDEFQAGIAPALIGIFFLIGLIFIFFGIIGEYIGFITIHILNRPLVIEECRFNFDTIPSEKKDEN
jgi:glycosyltransferase involved in cell wall biosynthesis